MTKIDILEKNGILGINRRNREYILNMNPRELYPLVDDKLKTKHLLEEARIPTPRMFFSISDNYEFRRLKQIRALNEFVIKPARGAMGRGILVVTHADKGKWVKSNGEVLTFEDIRYHVSNTLAGLYSLGGTNDKAFAEYRVKSHSVLARVSYQGAPDIRMIIYKKVPVMAMLRLPTKESDGKANLHQGGIGAGVDMSEGRTFGGVYYGNFIADHPDTGVPLSDIVVPFWDNILEMSVKVARIFKLGYFGIDFVIDETLGPMVLELNARPGLNIQIANREGLLERLGKLGLL